MIKREVLSPRSMAGWATPILASSSSVFAWMPTALVAALASCALSIKRQRMPRRRRSLVSVRPTGPAPTIKTSWVAAVKDKSFIFLHPFFHEMQMPILLCLPGGKHIHQMINKSINGAWVRYLGGLHILHEPIQKGVGEYSTQKHTCDCWRIDVFSDHSIALSRAQQRQEVVESLLWDRLAKQGPKLSKARQFTHNATQSSPLLWFHHRLSQPLPS